MSQENQELARIIVNRGEKLPVSTSLTRTQNEVTLDHALWAAIRNRTDAIRSESHIAFIDRVLNGSDPTIGTSLNKGHNRDKAKVTAKEVGAPSIKERGEALSELPGSGSSVPRRARTIRLR